MGVGSPPLLHYATHKSGTTNVQHGILLPIHARMITTGNVWLRVKAKKKSKRMWAPSYPTQRKL